MKSVFVPFGDVDQFSPAAVDKYEAAILNARKKNIKIKALVLCHPHNPIGQCYPRETIFALMKLCAKYKLHFISDEIYALSVYPTDSPDAVPFESVLSLQYSDYIDKKYVHVLYGFSKDLGASGLRLGCIYTQNSEFMRALSAISQFHWSGGPNEAIAISMLEDEVWVDGFLDRCRKLLASRSKLARSMLDEAGIKYHSAANAGFFLWLDLRPFLEHKENENPWEAEKRLVQRFKELKVFATDGASMSAEEPGFFRIVYTQEEARLKEGIRRIVKAVRSRA